MNRASKIGYALAMIIMVIVTLALTTMIVLQIVDIKQLTLKQVGVAVLAMTACTAVIGGGENGRKKDNSRH